MAPPPPPPVRGGFAGAPQQHAPPPPPPPQHAQHHQQHQPSKMPPQPQPQPQPQPPHAPTDDAESRAFLDHFSSPDAYVQELFQTLVLGVARSQKLPPADEHVYWATYDEYRDKVAEYGDVLVGAMRQLARLRGTSGHHGAQQQQQQQQAHTSDPVEQYHRMVEVLDDLLERAGANMDVAAGVANDTAASADLPLAPPQQRRGALVGGAPGLVGAASSRGADTVRRVITSANILRPQLRFGTIDNSDRPFVPILRSKPNAIVPLERSLVTETAFRSGAGAVAEHVSGLLPASDEFANPYRPEIEAVAIHPLLTARRDPVRWLPVHETPLVWVHTEAGLHELRDALERVDEFAVDLEHHDFRSFQGFTCLMQISTRTADYIVDTLELRQHMHVLNDVFTRPTILKVLHGADKDVVWLQRDFGIYIVSMFDTGQAARVLGYKRSLAFLLQKFCDFNADKSFQLADWRVRPLPAEMVEYARSDTHYLLYIKDMLLGELQTLRDSRGGDPVALAFDSSRAVCLQAYRRERFVPDGWLRISQKDMRPLGELESAVAAVLYEWRDHVARTNDESVAYTLPTRMLLDLACKMPTRPEGVIDACKPTPPLVRMHAAEIALLIARATKHVAASRQQHQHQQQYEQHTGTAVGLAAALAAGKQQRASPMLSKDEVFEMARWKPNAAQVVPAMHESDRAALTAQQQQEREQEVLTQLTKTPQQQPLAATSTQLAPANAGLCTGAGMSRSLLFGGEESDAELGAAHGTQAALARARGAAAAHANPHVWTAEQLASSSVHTAAAGAASSSGAAPAAAAAADGQAGDRFPRTIDEVYRISNERRKAGRDKKARRAGAGGDGGDGGDGGGGGGGGSDSDGGNGGGSESGGRAPGRVRPSDDADGFAREIGWMRSGSDAGSVGGAATAAGDGDDSDVSFDGSTGGVGAAAAASGAGGASRHRRRRSRGSHPTMDYASVVANPFAQAAAAPAPAGYVNAPVAPPRGAGSGGGRAGIPQRRAGGRSASFVHGGGGGGGGGGGSGGAPGGGSSSAGGGHRH